MFMTSLKKVENSQLKKELSIEEKISYIQYISDNYKNEKSLYKAMAKNTMKLVFTKGFGGKDLDNQTIQEINRVYVALKDLTINNTYNLVSDSTIQKESKSFVYKGLTLLPVQLIGKWWNCSDDNDSYRKLSSITNGYSFDATEDKSFNYNEFFKIAKKNNCIADIYYCVERNQILMPCNNGFFNVVINEKYLDKDSVNFIKQKNYEGENSYTKN